MNFFIATPQNMEKALPSKTSIPHRLPIRDSFGHHLQITHPRKKLTQRREGAMKTPLWFLATSGADPSLRLRALRELLPHICGEPVKISPIGWDPS
jgi:hypothetical protein